MADHMPETRETFQTIADLGDGDEFEGFFAVREARLQTTVNGKNYIRLTLADATGNVLANAWDADREIFQLCPAGSIVKVHGLVETYRGKLQVRVLRFRPAHDSEVEPDCFLPKSGCDITAMQEDLLSLVRSLTDADYSALAKAFFHNPGLMGRFSRAPAARDLHHAYIGGLLEHTLSVANMAACFAEKARVNRDLLLLGALLHDIGKMEELCLGLVIEYSNRGKLLGHLYIGAEMTAARVAGLDGFPVEKLDLIQHLILSHHGRLEYGSPVLPKIPEAFALHHLDNLDAKVDSANRVLDAIPNPDNRWSDFNRALEVSLFR
ncbi:MAG: HD domain-containing protein, partial [Planctomycetota bacterium]|nr:HD domain-containing protein [Planctomycetota bacterium]